MRGPLVPGGMEEDGISVMPVEDLIQEVSERNARAQYKDTDAPSRLLRVAKGIRRAAKLGVGNASKYKQRRTPLKKPPIKKKRIVNRKRASPRKAREREASEDSYSETEYSSLSDSDSMLSSDSERREDQLRDLLRNRRRKFNPPSTHRRYSRHHRRRESRARHGIPPAYLVSKIFHPSFSVEHDKYRRRYRR